MLNYIWLGLIGLAVLMGGFRGNIGDVGNAAVDSAKLAVEIAGGLIGVMTLWLGLMRLAEKAGLVNRLGLALKPIMVWLFPEVPPDHPAMGAIIMNMAANILGLNNAATPLGLRAMNELESLNRRPGVATNAMCMLLAINTSSITLIPVTVIALLAFYHGKNPTVIIGTSLAATAIAHAAAIASCKLLERSPWFRLPAINKSAKARSSDPETKAEKIHEKDAVLHAHRVDAELPWVPNAGRMLAVVTALFLASLFVTAFRGFIGSLQSQIDPTQIFPMRLLDATWLLVSQVPLVVGRALLAFTWPINLRHFIDGLSLLAIPWLILFFPLYAALRRIPVYDEFVEGAKEGFQVILRILPYIVAMLVAVGMFKTAGGMDVITWLLSPITHLLHFPAELVPLALIRPFSGTASLALLTEVIKNNGPDSLIALTAGTFYGCSETTFYVIAVYFGSVGIRKTRHAIPAGLVADVIGPIASVIICRAVLG